MIFPSSEACNVRRACSDIMSTCAQLSVPRHVLALESFFSDLLLLEILDLAHFHKIDSVNRVAYFRRFSLK